MDHLSIGQNIQGKLETCFEKGFNLIAPRLTTTHFTFSFLFISTRLDIDFPSARQNVPPSTHQDQSSLGSGPPCSSGPEFEWRVSPIVRFVWGGVPQTNRTIGETL